MSENIQATISPESKTVNPGDQVEFSLTLQNLGNIVDVFTIDADGIDPSWIQLETTSVSLFPGDKVSNKIFVNVPKDSSALAQTYNCNVKVTSRKDPSDFAEASLEFSIEAFYSLSASIEPQRSSGAVGEFTITLVNDGNADIVCYLEGSDPDSACRYIFEPRAPEVKAGETTTVSAKVEPGNRPLRFPALRYHLTFEVNPRQDTAAPITLQAEFDATPKLPKWAIPAAIAGAVALVAVIAIVVVVAIFSGNEGPVGNFTLNLGAESILRLQRVDGVPNIVEITGKWTGNAEELDVIVKDSSGVPLIDPPLKITKKEPSVRFDLDKLAPNQPNALLTVNIINAVGPSQATGTIQMKPIN